jgi:hypothetical protein
MNPIELTRVGLDNRSANQYSQIMKWLIPLLAVLPVLCGCGDTIGGKAIAESEVARFHDRLKAGEIDEIYSSADAALRNAVSKEKLSELFAAMNRKLGRLKSSREINWSVKTFNLRTTAVVVQESVFDRGTATETFTYVIKDREPKLVGYNVNSWEMMVR